MNTALLLNEFMTLILVVAAALAPACIYHFWSRES